MEMWYFVYPSSVDGHWGYFHLLAIVNAKHVGTSESESLLSIPLASYLGVELLDHMVILCLTF